MKARLDKWITADGYTRQGLTIEELAATLVTNRTYLSSYIKTVYHVSFREWIAELRIVYAKQQLVQHPELTVAAISEASGFLSLSYFTKIFTTKEGCPPSKWRKRAIANG
jgi:YesN/AraC family two-component response regulator